MPTQSNQTKRLLKLIEKAAAAKPVLRRRRLRERRKVIRIPKSAVQKRIEREARRHARAEYNMDLGGARSELVEIAKCLQKRHPGHTLQYYIDDITQNRTAKSKREVTLWNCFVHEELKVINGGLPPNAPHSRSSDPKVTGALKKKWKELTDMYTKEELKERFITTFDLLTQLKAEKAHGTHNHSISAFHDVRATIYNAEQMLNDLFARTGYETILIGARKSQESFETPTVFATSVSGANFLQSQLKAGCGADTGIIFEGYLSQGLHVTADSHIKSLVQLKSTTSNLIAQRLEELLKAKVKRIFYSDFENKMTRAYGVRIIGWPLQKFCSPGDLSVYNDVQVLFNAWESGMTRWEKLSEEEYRAFTTQLTAVASGGEETLGHSQPSFTTSPTTGVLSNVNPNIDPRLMDTTSEPSQGSVRPESVQPPGKKPRKVRSDAGKKRGPRKKSNNENRTPVA